MALMEKFEKGKRTVGGKEVRSIKVPVYNPRAAEDAITSRRRSRLSSSVTRLPARQRIARQRIDEAHRSFMGRNPHLNLSPQSQRVSYQHGNVAGIPGRKKGITAAHEYLKRAAKKSKLGKALSMVGSLLGK